MNEEDIDLTNIWGEEQLFKGVKIYPVQMKQITKLYRYIGCLLINKNEISDIRVIKMDYLTFLFALGQNQIIQQLYNLLALVLKDQLFKIDAENNKIKLIVRILVKNEIDKKEVYKNVEINGKEFEQLRKIILKQNNMKFDEELMNPEVKKALEEAQDFLNRRNKNKQATLEEMIASYHSALGIKYEDIKQETVYQFYKGLQRKSLEFKSSMLSTAWGMGGIKNEDLIDWLSHMDSQGQYDDVISKESPDDIKKKFE